MLKPNFQSFKLILNINFCFLEQDGEGIMETLKTYEDKIQQLEKDLYFYKKTSRDLKKKLKELLGEAIQRRLVPSESKTFSATCHAVSLALDEVDLLCMLAFPN